jgi:hypothetical protein
MSEKRIHINISELQKILKIMEHYGKDFTTIIYDNSSGIGTNISCEFEDNSCDLALLELEHAPKIIFPITTVENW